MKNNYTITLVSLLLLLNGALTVNSQHLKASRRADKAEIIQAESPAESKIIHLPRKLQRYLWNQATGAYDLGSTTFNNYDSKGNILSQITLNALEDTTYKVYTTYDSYGNEIENKSYSRVFETKNWELVRYTNQYKYDLQGRILEKISMKYNGGIAINDYKDVSTYANNSDQGFNTFAEYQWENNTWVLRANYINIVWKNFTEDEPLSYTTQELVDGKLIDKERFNIVYTGKNYIENIELYENKAWVQSSRKTGAYDNAGTLTVIEQEYLLSVWTNVSRQQSFVDTKGEDAGYLLERWVVDAWEPQSMDKKQNTYNSNNQLTESISEFPNDLKIKTIFSDFVSITTGNLSETLESAFQFYPNPAKDYILVNTSSSETYTINAINALGVQVPVQFSSNDRIDLSNWNPGIFHLSIRSSSGKNFSKKIIKE